MYVKTAAPNLFEHAPPSFVLRGSKNKEFRLAYVLLLVGTETSTGPREALIFFNGSFCFSFSSPSPPP